MKKVKGFRYSVGKYTVRYVGSIITPIVLDAEY